VAGAAVHDVAGAAVHEDSGRAAASSGEGDGSVTAGFGSGVGEIGVASLVLDRLFVPLLPM
jgi:hypothetical protein